GTVQPGSAEARGGHEAGLDELGQNRNPGPPVAEVHQCQPADAVPGPARPAGRDELRRPAPLRVLGARTLESPLVSSVSRDTDACVHHEAASRRPAAKGSGWIGAPG